MKIILLQDVKTLGKKGDVKDVSEGYARNFLISKKLAQIATEGAVKNVEAKKAQKNAFEKANLEKLRELAEKLKDRRIVLESREKKGKLFGSILAKDIALELKKENLEISEKSIILKETIKKIGEYKIEIRLEKDIKSQIILEVRGENS
jgi:large subunit ribosomal protein L9